MPHLLACVLLVPHWMLNSDDSRRGRCSAAAESLQPETLNVSLQQSCCSLVRSVFWTVHTRYQHLLQQPVPGGGAAPLQGGPGRSPGGGAGGRQGNAVSFGYHSQRPLPTDAVLVDEASMLDLPLAAALLDAVPRSPATTFQLVLVGAPALPQLASGHAALWAAGGCVGWRGTGLRGTGQVAGRPRWRGAVWSAA